MTIVSLPWERSFTRNSGELLDRIRTETSSLARLETYSGPHDVRRILFQRFPYVAVVLRRPDELIVIAVAHVRRRPLYWLNRLES